MSLAGNARYSNMTYSEVSALEEEVRTCLVERELKRTHTLINKHKDYCNDALETAYQEYQDALVQYLEDQGVSPDDLPNIAGFLMANFKLTFSLDYITSRAANRFAENTADFTNFYQSLDDDEIDKIKDLYGILGQIIPYFQKKDEIISTLVAQAKVRGVDKALNNKTVAATILSVFSTEEDYLSYRQTDMDFVLETEMAKQKDMAGDETASPLADLWRIGCEAIRNIDGLLAREEAKRIYNPAYW